MNRKFISKSNLVLRKILNSKDNLDILQDLIESFLDIKIQEITLNPYLEIKSKYLPKEENFGVADVRVTLENGEELNIGVQFIDGYYVQQKMLLYYTQIHFNQLAHDKTRNMARTITINILDFMYFASKEYHKKWHIECNPNKYSVNEELELHVFELPKFKQMDKQNILREEAWMIYLKGESKLLIQKVLKDFPKIKKLDDLLEKYWKEEKME